MLGRSPTPTVTEEDVLPLSPPIAKVKRRDEGPKGRTKGEGEKVTRDERNANKRAKRKAKNAGDEAKLKAEKEEDEEDEENWQTESPPPRKKRGKKSKRPLSEA